MTATRAKKTVRWAGVGIGLCLAALLTVSWRLPPGTDTLGAEVRVTLLSTGEIDASPAGHILTAPNLGTAWSSSPPSRAVALRNLTGRTLDVSARALPSSKSLDDALAVVLEIDGRVLYRGSLGGLRHWSHRTFGLPRAESARLSVAVAIPPGISQTVYRGRIEDVTVELRAQPRGSA